jgi:hypothetical protein
MLRTCFGEFKVLFEIVSALENFVELVSRSSGAPQKHGAGAISL